jgi:hypothetical protein
MVTLRSIDVPPVLVFEFELEPKPPPLPPNRFEGVELLPKPELDVEPKPPADISRPLLACMKRRDSRLTRVAISVVPETAKASALLVVVVVGPKRK